MSLTIVQPLQQAHTAVAGAESELANPPVTIHLTARGISKPMKLSKIVPDPRLQPIVTNLLRCESLRKHWDQMLQEGAFRIRFATIFDTQMMGSAMTTANRAILLNKDLSYDDLVGSIVFELGNLSQVKNLRGFQDFPSADAFALHREDLEYETWNTAHHLSSHLLAEGFLSRQEYPYLTKEEYLTLQENGGHTDLYRCKWYATCDPEGGKAWYEANLPRWEKS